MADRKNLDSVTEKVVDLSMTGQGCAVWDEINSLSRADLEQVLNGAQKKSPNANPQEVRSLPALKIDTSSIPGAIKYNIDLIDPNQKTLETKILHGVSSAIFSDWHKCINLVKPSPTN